MISKHDKSRKSRPPFREQIQNHPFTALAGACAAVGLIIVAIVQYHYNEKREVLLEKKSLEIEKITTEYKALLDKKSLEIEKITKKYEKENNELKKRFALIKRETGGKEYFDVAQFFSESRPESFEHVKDGKFRAFLDKFESKWKKEGEVNVRDYRRSIHGENNDYVKYKDMFPVIETTRIYVWKGLSEIVDNKRFAYKRIFPYVSVEYMPTENFAPMLGKMNKHIEEASRGWLTFKPWLISHDKDFPIDVASFALHSILQDRMMFQIFNPSIKTRLTHIEKARNMKPGQYSRDVLYMREFSKIGQTKSGEKLYDDYYITRETFLVATPKSIHAVTTQIPSPDSQPGAQDDYSPWVTEWLSNFRIADEE